MYSDTRSRFDRVGFSSTYKNVAMGLISVTIVFIALLAIATAFTNMATAQIQAKDTIASIRYLNIRHK